MVSFGRHTECWGARVWGTCPGSWVQEVKAAPGSWLKPLVDVDQASGL